MASSSTGGYDHEFLSPPAKLKKCECPLCLLVTREPNLTSCCGQHFCQSCINQVLIDQRSCPLCKEAKFTVFLDKSRRRKILELKVQCSLKDRGCDWTGGLGELATHVDFQDGSCQFVDLTCPNSCGESFHRRHLSQHLTSECRNRPFMCEHCQFNATFELVCQHYNECERFPLSCPNECDIQSVERAKMVEHLSQCPMQLVECEYAYAGCNEKIRRESIAIHMEQNVQKHLMWAFTASQKQIQCLEKKVEALQKENAEMKQQSTRLQAKAAALEQHTALQDPMEFTVFNCSDKDRSIRMDSPTFYPWPRGPKMCMSINFSRVIEIELHHLPGEFDEEIEWPVISNTHLYVLNQESDQNHLDIESQFLFLNKPTKQRCVVKCEVDYAKVEDQSRDGVQYVTEYNRLTFRANIYKL